MMKKYRVKITGFKFGVPSTFIIDNYNPVQFEILGNIQRDDDSYRTKKYTKADSIKYNDLNRSTVLHKNGKLIPTYSRILIKNK